MEKDFSLLLARDQAMIEEYLSGLFRTEARYADLQEAMEYSLLSGGKSFQNEDECTKHHFKNNIARRQKNRKALFGRKTSYDTCV